MEEKKRDHENKKKLFKTIGWICLPVGIVLTVIGLVSLFSSMGSFEPPKFFFCGFIGLPLTGVGAQFLMIGYRREITEYEKNESVPVFNEAGEEMSPGIRSIASAMKEGWKEKEEGIVCSCGEVNPPDSSFCRKCGASLKNKCPCCGKEISGDSLFCNYCGEKIKKED